MKQHIIYWASATMQSELLTSCVEAAQSLSEAGVEIEHRQTGASLSSFSPELGSFQLDKTDIFGFLSTKQGDRLGALVLLTASAINPMLLLLAHGQNEYCSAESKRRFLQATMSYLEKEQATRIMLAYDQCAENTTAISAPKKPVGQFDKSCPCLAA